MNKLLISSVVLLALGVSGCTSTKPKMAVKATDLEMVESNIKDGHKQIASMDERGSYMKVDTDWIGGKKIERDTNKDKRLIQNVRLYSIIPLNVTEVGVLVTKTTGVAVRFNPDVFEVESDDDQATVDSTGFGQAQLALDAPSESIGINKELRPVDYEGTLVGFLDTFVGERNLSWRMDGDTVVIERYVTKVFHLDALPGNTEQTLSMGGSASGSESNVAKAQSTNITQSMDVWTATENVIKALLSDKGRVNVSKDSGTIVVTDSPSNVSRVSEYIEKENKKLTQQVAIGVKVLAVTRNDTDSLSIDWDQLLYSGGDLGFGFTSRTLLAGDNAANGSISLLCLSSDFSGSSAVIKALQSSAEVTDITSTTLLTLNSHIAPVEVTSTRAYIESVSTTTTGSSGATEASIEPGEVTTGLLMSVLPRILDGDKMLLQYMVDISTLDDLSSVSSGAETIQTPETSRRSFLQRVKVDSGDVIALAGFASVSNVKDKSGTLSKNNWILGGGKSDANSKTMLLILISPKIIK
jgi:type IVB pilus formation R64 PilN family outer membrane protein